MTLEASHPPSLPTAMADTESDQSSRASVSGPVFKKRSSRPRLVSSSRPAVGKEDEQEASEGQDTSNGQEEEEEERLSLEELIALRAMRVKPSGIGLDRLNKGEMKKKKNKKKQEAKVDETEEDRWAQQMEKGGLVVRRAGGGAGEKENPKDGLDEEDEDDEEEEGDIKKPSAAPRLVKQDNFQGETGTVDVDKHMMAYIEEEMRKRRQRGESDGSIMNSTDKTTLNADDELYSVDDKYRKILQGAKEALEAARKNVNGGNREKQKDDQEEGNATLSSAMLNGVPEVDLGMDHRMKNIEETERAKRAMMEAQRVKSRDVHEEEEGDFASARCEFVYHLFNLQSRADLFCFLFTVFKYGTKIQSDADILRRAEALGVNEDGTAIEDYSMRQVEHKRQTATDEAALERFKKRQRNQLKR